jgi:hypothetical protein
MQLTHNTRDAFARSHKQSIHPAGPLIPWADRTILQDYQVRNVTRSQAKVSHSHDRGRDPVKLIQQNGVERGILLERSWLSSLSRVQAAFFNVELAVRLGAQRPRWHQSAQSSWESKRWSCS